MKHILVFVAVFTASLALIVVTVAVALFAYAATSGRAVGIGLTSSTLPALLVFMFSLGAFSRWLTRRLLRPKVPGARQKTAG